MLFLKRIYPFILAIVVTIYAVSRDELLWLWATVLLIVFGVVNLRKDESKAIQQASKISSRILLIIGAIVLAAVIVYFLMVQGFSNAFDR